MHFTIDGGVSTQRCKTASGFNSSVCEFGPGLLAASSGSARACAAALSFEASLAAKLLPCVLSVTAGSVDVISFLGLGGLFVAHITGNLVVLAAHVVTGSFGLLGPMLSVPVFVMVLAMIRLVVLGLRVCRLATLWPLLALHFLLLVSFLIVRVAAGAGVDPNAPTAILAGMLGVAAMAVQNAVSQLSLVGAPATTVMTTDIAILLLDVGAALIHSPGNDATYARSRARRTWPAIAGFIVGCGLGAVLEDVFGPWSLAFPVAFGFLALLMGFFIGGNSSLEITKSARTFSSRRMSDVS
jgi:uncharacterized membrane protein YoaK (UPF0700 family)